MNQQLLVEDNSNYYDSDIESNIVYFGGDVDIISPDVRLGDEERHVVETGRVCTATPPPVNSNRKLENIVDNMLGCESDLETEEEEDNTRFDR